MFSYSIYTFDCSIRVCIQNLFIDFEREFSLITYHLTADDDNNKGLDDEYYNEVTRRKRVKVSEFNCMPTYIIILLIT